LAGWVFQLFKDLPSLNPKVHYHVHKTLSLDTIPSQINPVHILRSCLRSIFILFSHLPCGLVPSVLPNKFYILHLSHAYYISNPSYLASHCHINSVYQRVKIIMLL
jgi:hypothetical protein